MSSRLCSALFFVLVSLSVSAQKVKYKDLIVLLNSKQYDKAEPFLKRYLKENDDNPNAYLYMGIVFQDKLSKIDPLLQTNSLCSTIDSALTNYDKAYQTITEKELKKNDEYYEPYMRRDLRTGKFVIKLSDVQLDVETRTRNLKEKKEKAKLLRSYFDESSATYARAVEVYKSIQEKYESEKAFFLRSDDETLASLKRLSFVFDSCMQAFEKYKSTTKEFGKTGHDQVLSLQEIKDMKRDGVTPGDFLKDDLKLWDFKKWASNSNETIEKEIIPLREQLISFDIEINKLRVTLQKDSVPIKNNLGAFEKKMSASPLKKYDSNPMPMNVFAMKVAELEYFSDVILNKPFRDTSDVRLRLAAAKMEINDLKALDSITTLLSNRNFTEDQKDYSHFITKAYGTPSVLQSTIAATLEYVKREKAKRIAELNSANESLKWIISAGDSIPLFTESAKDLKFKPLLVETDKFTFGINYKDTLSSEGYFYSITPSRIPEVKTKYAVDKSAFKKRLFPYIKGLAATDASGNSFITLTYSTQKIKDKFNTTVAKIYRADGLAWSNDFSFDSLPSDLSLNPETGDIQIKMLTSDGSVKIVTIDKGGKLVK